jgi:putative ABC transport system permease protein
MKQQHKLNYADYVIDTQEGLLKQINVILLAFQIVFGGVAGLSLLTGGIGIMNIMLVSVTERTREIGIRKAVGAPSGAIMTQFVVEAVTVSSLGGAIGTLIGYCVAALIDHVAHKNLPTSVPLWAVILGVGFAAVVGMFFGIYPAYRASQLDPIVALRSE